MFYITNGKNSNKKGQVNKNAMCQDIKNEVINYYRYINIPSQVRVRLEETFTHFKIKLRVTRC